MKRLASIILVSGLLVFLIGFSLESGNAEQETTKAWNYLLKVGMLKIHIPWICSFGGTREKFGPEKWAERIKEWDTITDKTRELMCEAIDSYDLDIILAPEFSFCKKTPYSYKEMMEEVADFQKKLKKNGPVLFLPFVYIDNEETVYNVVIVVAPPDTKLIHDPILLSDGRVLEIDEHIFCYYKRFDLSYNGCWTRARMDRERNYVGGKSLGIFYLLNPNKYGKLKIGLEICADFGDLYKAWEYVDLQILIANNVYWQCYPYFRDVAVQHFLLCDGIRDWGGPTSVIPNDYLLDKEYWRIYWERYFRSSIEVHPSSIAVHYLPVKEFQVDSEKEKQISRARRLGLKRKNPCASDFMRRFK